MALRRLSAARSAARTAGRSHQIECSHAVDVVVGVGPRTVRFRDLRHLAGTEAASAGASLREVMARMGHSTPNASLRYLKASELRDREIADRVVLRMPVFGDSRPK